MPSFEIIYEDDEDVLEVTFADFDEHFAKTIPLNDSIVLYADLSLSVTFGLTLYGFSNLLQVNETHLSELALLPPDDARRIVNLLGRPPASSLVEMLDPSNLVARVKAPHLRELLPK